MLSLLAGFTAPDCLIANRVQVQRVLSAMLTPDLVQTLVSPGAFVQRVTEGRAQLQPLLKYIEGELIEREELR